MEYYKQYRFQKLLRMYGLDVHMDTPISMKDLLLINRLVIQEEEPENHEDLPRHIFHKVMGLNYTARTTQLRKKTVSKQYGDSKRKVDKVHPIDLFLAMFLCSDMFVQQYFVTKLSQCQLALPFLIQNPNKLSFFFPFWAFKQIKKSWSVRPEKGALHQAEGYETQHIIDAKSKVISFIRYGSSKLSKSSLMNSTLSQSHDIFIHRNCKGSTKNRILVDGTAEITWYLPGGKKDDVFSELVTFINLRGDASECERQCEFLSNISTTLVVVLSKIDDREDASHQIKKFSSTVKVLYVTDDIICFEDPVGSSENGWSEDINELNTSEFTEFIQQSLKNIVSTSSQTMSLAKCVQRGKNEFGIHCDEDNQCIKGKDIISKIMTKIKSTQPLETVKNTLFPLQGDEWHKWSETEKIKFRPKLSNNETILEHENSHNEKMKYLRKQQSEKGLPLKSTMNDVITCLARDYYDVMFFVKSMKFELDRRSTKMLIKLNDEYNKLWHEIQDTKNRTEDKNIAKLQIIKQKIASSSIGNEHFMKEISQIFECVHYTQNLPNQAKTYLDYKTLPKLAANLLLNGHTIELMDGDAGHVPAVWIEEVLTTVSELTKNARVFVLSVLGVQSSGKSTLLNVMFGLQFSVGAGRCTKGAYMRLLKVSDDMHERLKYKFILVIDTEGLRSSEFYNTSTVQTRDNELATFVIGIGDVTLLNIFGENPSDIYDVLQIVVQAFLRMKKVHISPRCYFVHQNVGVVDAKGKLKGGQRNMIDKLNEVTRDVALQEDSNEQLFSEVIAFDQEESFYYLSNLWEGDPPMAPPNPGYSEKVQNLKRTLLNLPAKEDIYCLKLDDLKGRIKDMWQALLCENFVFNFKNSLEISVYREVEERFNQWKLHLYRCVEEEQDKALNIIENARGNTLIFKEVQRNISKAAEDTYKKVRGEGQDYFDHSERRHIAIQWKEKTMFELQSVKNSQVDKANAHCQEFLNGQMARNQVQKIIENTESIFFQEAKKLAQRISQDTTDNEKKEAFDNSWNVWLKDIKTSPIENIDAWVEAEQFLTSTYKSRSLYIFNTHNDLKNFVFKPNIEDHCKKPKKIKTFTKTEKESIRDQVTDIAKSISEGFDSHLKNLTELGVDKYRPGADKYFTNVLKTLTDDVNSHNKTLKDFQLSNHFKIDLVLVAVSKTVGVLEQLHKKYVEKHDPKRIIDDKKKDIYDVFLKHVAGTNAGIVAAEIWIQKVRDAVWSSCKKKSSAIIKDHIMSNAAAFNGNRSKLDLHMKEFLVQNENFQDYMVYIKTPKRFVERFVQRCVHDEVVNKDAPFNTDIKREFNVETYKLQILCIDAHENAASQSNITPMLYIEKFQEDMKQYLSLGSVVDSFSHQANKLTGLYVEFFLQQIKQRLPQIKESCNEMLENLLKNKTEFASITAEVSTELSDFYTSQCCWELCPFCQEMCTNTMKDHDGDHSVMFHKPQGIGGWYHKKTKNLVLDQCTHLVQTDLEFHANLEDEAFVKYKNYRKAGSPYDKWSITADRSLKKHWQWFIARFQKEIEKHYGKEIKDIPSSWKEITKAQVLQELQPTKD